MTKTEGEPRSGAKGQSVCPTCGSDDKSVRRIYFREYKHGKWLPPNWNKAVECTDPWHDQPEGGGEPRKLVDIPGIGYEYEPAVKSGSHMHQSMLDEILTDVLAYCDHNGARSFVDKWSKEKLAFAIRSMLADQQSLKKALANKTVKRRLLFCDGTCTGTKVCHGHDDAQPTGPAEGVTPDALADAIEKVLFRRALEHKLEGYTIETAKEIADVARAGTDERGREAQLWRDLDFLMHRYKLLVPEFQFDTPLQNIVKRLSEHEAALRSREGE